MKPLGKYIACAAIPVALFAQALDPSKLTQPPTDSWPTYNGDYSGRRYSTLSKINDSNITSLSLAWISRVREAGNFAGDPKNHHLPFFVC